VNRKALPLLHLLQSLLHCKSKLWTTLEQGLKSFDGDVMTDEMPTMSRFERRETDVLLTYADGSEFSVTYDDLRHSCPCAKCSPLRNEDEASKNLRRQVEALPKEKPKVRIVGNYALGFEWTQGCSSGIFRFERIWDLANRRDPDNGKPYVHGAW
jgi:DUF971 family protein